MPHDPGPAFRALHRRGDPFVLCNAWDIGSARMLAAVGAQALGTTSAGHAFTLGRADGGRVSRDESMAHCAALAAATPLPVSGDLENGYGPAPDDVAETVRLAAEAGLAGCSIEDIDPENGAAYDRAFAVERIRAGASAARALPRDFVFVARADGVLAGAYDLDEALARITAFDAAGADCLYVPAPGDEMALARVIAATAKPVNALAVGAIGRLGRARLSEMGVARISLGAALARMTHLTLRDAAAAILNEGRFDAQPMLQGAETDALLEKGSA